jgi:tetratricopeptide (TPR) repeat protein
VPEALQGEAVQDFGDTPRSDVPEALQGEAVQDWPPVQVPTRVAGRFTLEAETGSGGMGTVYRARDEATGATVAVKLLRGASAPDAERFARESAVLADFDHPAIVRYIAHGKTDDGVPYLAMSWLVGETLQERLQRGPLSARETVAVLLGAARGLAVAHRRGVVHRDIKPSNLFLLDGLPEKVVLLDFGIAKWLDESVAVTHSGALVGTPSYMAPEQARGLRALDPRVDVFALGTVGYRCLAGAAPFAADTVLVTLFRIVFHDPDPLGARAPNAPAPVAAAVERLLAKAPADRPADGDAVVALLTALAPAVADTRAPAAAPPAITGGEQQLVAVALARAPGTGWRRPADAQLQLAAAALRFGGRLELVVDGSALILFAGPGAASDLARRAARCALAVRDAVPEAAVAVGSGRIAMSARAPVGEVIDRVVAAAGEATSGKITIDAATAGLLDAQFVVDPATAGNQLLRGARDEVDVVRTVLGKVPSLVGRDRELAMLDAVIDECVADRVARAVVITAPAGAGKTRLRQELVRRAVQRLASLEVLTGRADPLRAGAAHALLADAVRRSAGVVATDAIERQRERLATRVARHVAAGDRDRVACFLGELAGVPFPDAGRDALRTARRDHALHHDATRAAWLDWLGAEADAQPILLVLEDLHWADRPSVELVDAALRRLADRRLCVIALARPEVAERFPALWDKRDPQLVRLAPLQARASHQLVEQLLGVLSDDAATRIVERATGNPLFLEELARAVAAGHDHDRTLPDSVLLMLQARLDGVDPDARRILRAASVFGERFTTGGVAALVADRPAEDARDHLRNLAVAELIIEQAGGAGGPAGERWAFRHALVRDAAYATLTEADRVTGHVLAAEWTEAHQAAPPAVIAEHYVRGARPDRAVAWFIRGADAALAGNDFVATIDLAERGLAAGATGEPAGVLRVLACEAHNWRREPERASADGELAIGLVPRGSRDWFHAMDELFMASTRLGRIDRCKAIVFETFSVEPLDERAHNAKVSCLARAVIVMIRFGTLDVARLAIARLDAVAGDVDGLDRHVAARIYTVRGLLARADGDADRAMECHRLGLEALTSIGDRRSMGYHTANYVSLLAELGQTAEADRVSAEMMLETERLGLLIVHTLSQFARSVVVMRLGRHDEAIGLLESAIAASTGSGDKPLVGMASAAMVEALVRAGRPGEALALARPILARPDVPPDGLALVLAWVALAHAARGEHADAIAAARRARDSVRPCHGFEVGESSVRLAEIDVLAAAGRRDDARAATTAAIARLAERAARIGDAWRGGFLSVEENAATLARAAELGVELPGALALTAR